MLFYIFTYVFLHSASILNKIGKHSLTETFLTDYFLDEMIPLATFKIKSTFSGACIKML